MSNTDNLHPLSFVGAPTLILLFMILFFYSVHSLNDNIYRRVQYEKCQDGKLTLLIKNADGSQTYYKTEATCK
jgi:hypothetical protein